MSLGTINSMITSENIGTLANILSIGASAKGFLGNMGLKNFLKTFKKTFPEGIETEKQQKILLESFIEIENYIKKDPKLNSDILTNIYKVLIKGLKEEEIKTRVYIKTLKELTYEELLVLKACRHYPGGDRLQSSRYLTNYLINKVDLPRGLIDRCLKELIDKFLVPEQMVKQGITDFGIELLDFIEEI